MRLYDYLNEGKETTDDVIEILKSECKPFIRFLKKNNFLFYRGSRKRLNGLKFKNQRIDTRKPLDTSRLLHRILNKLFLEKFGWKVRNGVFCMMKESETTRYGTACLVFGVGSDIKYCWNPFIFDLYSSIDSKSVMKKVLGKSNDKVIEEIDSLKFGFKFLDGKKVSEEAMDYLKKLVSSYKKSGLDSKAGEVVFNFPDGYYLVNLDFHRKRDIVKGLGL